MTKRASACLITLASAGAIFVGCGRQKADIGRLVEAPARVIDALPSGHHKTRSLLVAVDLEHGGGSHRVMLQRQWAGRDTIDTQFGYGWSDANHLRLTLIDPRTALIWRGGAGWRVAYSNDGEFRTINDDRLTRNGGNWTFHERSGDTLTFDESGRLTASKSGDVTFKYEYDPSGRLTKLSSDSENFLRYTYDTTGRVKQVDGPEELHATYRYDDKGRLVEVTNDLDIKIAYVYDDRGDLVSMQDKFGRQRKIDGALVAASPKAKGPDTGATGDKAEVDERRQTKNSQRPGDKLSLHDSAGFVALTKSPSPQNTYRYDRFGRVTEIVDRSGVTTRFAYNKFDLPTLITLPGKPAEKYTYNSHGMLVRRERSLTDWQEFSYDTNGRMITRRRGPFGAEEQFAYDDRDNVVARKFPDGKEVTYTYDANGRLLTETWSSGEKIMCRYNGEGQLAEVTDATGLRTEFTYQNGKLVESSDPIHGRMRLTEQNGTLTVERDGIGKATETATVWGKPLALTATGGRKTTFLYDDRGLPVITILPDDIPWRYNYDAVGALESIASPGGVNISLKRDELGRITEILRGDIVWRQFRYNDTGQLTEEFSPLGSAARYERDKQGQLAAITQPGGKVTISYSKDRARRLKGKDFELEEQVAPNRTVVRRNYISAKLDLKLPRDNAGRPAGVELNGLKAAYQYDGRGQLARIDLPSSKSITIGRDEAGRITKLSMTGVASVNRTYDRADRITSLEAANAAGASVFREAYKFDVAGNLSEIQTGEGVERFEYDALDRLKKISGGKNPREFRYDVDGNLWWNGAKHAVLDKLGRPVEEGATRFSWDFAGNLVRIEDSAKRVENTFDAASRLTQRTRESEGSTYAYLPNGDRVWKQGDKGKRWFAYVEENLAGIKDESGTTWLLVNMPGTDWPLALCGSNGKTLFIIADRLNSTRRFIDESGNVVAARDFDAFGKIAEQSGDAPLGLFAGMLDDGNGFYYARQRYYEASIARFISIDPLIGTYLDPASHNAYAYAANNPLRYRDPQGTGFTDEIEDGNLYGHLTREEQAATTRAYQEAERARRVLANPASSAGDVATANRHLVDCEAALEELNRRARIRYKAALLAGPTEELSEVGKRAAAENLAEARRAVAELGEAPSVAAVRFEGGARGGTIKVGVSSGTEASASTTGRVNLAAGESAQVSAQRLAEIERAIANNEAVILTKAESEALLRGGRAGAGEAAAEIAEQAGKSAVAAGEVAAKSVGLGGRLLKALRPLLPWLGAAGLVSDMYLSYEVGSGFRLMSEAAGEANDASAIAKTMAAQLGERLAKLAAEDPKKLLPMPDGKPFDPNNPEHIDNLMVQLHSNLTKNRKPFEGIIATEPDPEQQAQLDAAIAAARKLITQGHDLEKEAVAAQTVALQKESEVQGEIQTALKIAGVRSLAEADLAQLPTAADNVKKGTVAAQEEAQKLQAAEGEMAAAVAKTESAATRTCEFAQQAPNATEEQVGTWQNEASSLIFESSNQLNAAQEKIERTDVAADDLQRAIAVLQGYKTGQELLQFADQVKASVSGAKAAQVEATKARADVTKAMGAIHGIPGQVTSILQPVSWSPLIVPVQAEADALGANVEEPGMFSVATLVETALPTIDAFLANLNQVEQTISSTNIDALVTAAQSALETANNTRTRVRSLAAKPERYAALQRASQCMAAIKFSGKSVAEKSPSPTATAEAKLVSEEVTVPDLSGYQAAIEIDGALSQAGLVKTLVAAQDKPPSKEKEFKFASQAPAAGTKVKRGSTVTVAFYPKFEEPATDEVVVPDLSVFDSTSEMKATLAHAGLTGSFVSTKDKAPSKEKEFKFASQSPSADTKVKGGSTVTVAFYPKFEEPATDEVVVPDLSVFSSTSEMKATLAHAGLTGSFISAKDKAPSKEKEFKFASQSPSADTKVKRDSTVTVAFYPKFEEAAAAEKVPNVIGLDIRDAQTKIEAAGLKLVGVESGTLKPPSPDKAYKIYAQIPAAGEPAPGNKLVTVKEYGAAPSPSPAAEISGNEDFAGNWAGSCKVDIRPGVSETSAGGYVIKKQGGVWTVSDPKSSHTDPATLSGSQLVLEQTGGLGTFRIVFERRGDTLLASCFAIDRGRTTQVCNCTMRRQ